MKSIKLIVVALFMAFTFSATAQNSTEKAVLTMFEDVAKAFSSNNDEHGWSYYTENAFEIGPDGSYTVGKKALRASWDGFMKMADTRPTFTYTNPSVKVLSPEVAIITFDSEADIKIQGQQVGGKTKGIAVVHKINGKWQIEGDAITPVVPMPTETIASNDNVIKEVYDKAMKAFNTLNVPALVDLFSETATHIAPTGAIVKGKAALTQHYTALFKIFAQMPKPDSRKTEVLDMAGQYLNPELYLTTYREKNTYTFGTKTKVEELTYSVLLAKKNGKWLIENLTLTPQVDMASFQVAKN